MKYISQINAFWNWARLNELPSGSGYLYFAILDCANTCGWKDEFNAPNSTLQAMAGLDRYGLTRYRNILIQAGLITYKQGKRGNAGIYTITPLYDEDGAICCTSATSSATDNATSSAHILQQVPHTSCNNSCTHTKSKSKSKSKSSNPISTDVDIAPCKKPYGEFNNVLLSDPELEKLKARFSDWDKRIERLSVYIANHPNKYKNHYATILTWADMDTKKGENNARQGSGPNFGITL